MERKKKRDGIAFYELLLLVWLIIIAYNFLTHSKAQNTGAEQTSK